MAKNNSNINSDTVKPTTEPLTQLYLIFAAISLGIGAEKLFAESQFAAEAIRFVVLFVVVVEWLHSQIAFGNTEIDTVPSKKWQLMAIEFYIDIAADIMPVIAAFNLKSGGVFYIFIALIYGLDILVEYLSFRRLGKNAKFNRAREILLNWIKLDLFAFPAIIITVIIFNMGSISPKELGEVIVLAIVISNAYLNYSLNRDFYFGVHLKSKNDS